MNPKLKAKEAGDEAIEDDSENNFFEVFDNMKVNKKTLFILGKKVLKSSFIKGHIGQGDPYLSKENPEFFLKQMSSRIKEYRIDDTPFIQQWIKNHHKLIKFLLSSNEQLKKQEKAKLALMELTFRYKREFVDRKMSLVQKIVRMDAFSSFCCLIALDIRISFPFFEIDVTDGWYVLTIKSESRELFELVERGLVYPGKKVLLGNFKVKEKNLFQNYIEIGRNNFLATNSQKIGLVSRTPLILYKEIKPKEGSVSAVSFLIESIGLFQISSKKTKKSVFIRNEQDQM